VGAGKLLSTVATVAEMAARGFGLEPAAFTSRMHNAPHLLAPTGVCVCVCMVGGLQAGALSSATCHLSGAIEAVLFPRAASTPLPPSHDVPHRR
jgi:hypothetical protein